MAPPGDLDALSPTELKAFVVRLLGKVAALEQAVAAQRAEIARLKGLKGRPALKPSGMEKAGEPKPPHLRKGRRGPVTPRVAVEDQVIKATVPPGSRFKGYVDFVVQDLVLRACCLRYRWERWLTPAGQLGVAPLPSGVDRHFGPELRRFVLAQYHQGQVTVPRLVAQLRTIGLAISTRQVMRLLIDGQQRFLDEARDVLRAGLTQAAWITVDDTGARHKAANGTCTQIGNDHFAWFGTTASKSRAPWFASATHGAPAYPLRSSPGIQAESFTRNPYHPLSVAAKPNISGGPHARERPKAPWRGPARVGRPRPEGVHALSHRDVRQHADDCHGSCHGHRCGRVRNPGL